MGVRTGPACRKGLAFLTVVLVFAIASETGFAFNTKLRRYPYLTDVVGSYATVNWATDRSRKSGVLRYGRRGRESCRAHAVRATRRRIEVNSVPQYQWRARLSGLKPGARYCYRVYLGRRGRTIDLLASDPSPRFRRQLRRGSRSSFSFAVFGDWGAMYPEGNPHQANVLSKIASSGARFAVTVGDNTTESGSQANYGDLYQRGEQLSGVFAPTSWAMAGSSLPIFPAIGNHGHSNANHLINWPQHRAVALSRGRYAMDTYCCTNGTRSASYPSAWYAFDSGRARFYVLQAAWSDTNVGTADLYKNDFDNHWVPSSPQYRWLERDLARHSRSVKFAFVHFPFHSDNAAGQSSDPYLQGSGGLEGLLGRLGVNLAFSGNAHIYQRNHASFPGAPVTYVTGGGGDRRQPIGGRGCSPLDAYGIGWSYSANFGAGRGSACGGAPLPTDISQTFHFLLVRVDTRSVTVTPTDSLGRVFDVMTYPF
jgi:Calcineurin-like phosphoesterase/Purple acid Phosphatase, N-terminal domain